MAQIFIAYCAGNIIGPQLFFEDEAPSYPSGFLSMLICFGVAFVTCFILRFYLVWVNKRRDQEATPADEEDAGDVNLADKTVKEIQRFRYVY